MCDWGNIRGLEGKIIWGKQGKFLIYIRKGCKNDM